MHTEELRAEYDLARAYTRALYDDLAEADLLWRPTERSSGIAWHLGHQAAVNHFLVRNLVAAEPSPDPAMDSVFDAATDEQRRGELPAVARIVSFRDVVAARTHLRIDAVLAGAVGAQGQMQQVIDTLLLSLINHEYQHDTWIGEVRATIGKPALGKPASTQVRELDGYWTLSS